MGLTFKVASQRPENSETQGTEDEGDENEMAPVSRTLRMLKVVGKGNVFW
jgi:hypothetical protein